MATQRLPLMPKATAIWLIENTTLTFDQIADFCGLHALEVQALADDEVSPGMTGMDPIANGQVSKEEIERCEKDSAGRLTLAEQDLPEVKARGKGPRYTPVAKRGDKPNAIAWILKHEPELGDAQICRLIGTTKPTIDAVRNKSHWNAPNIKAENPVALGLCTRQELDAERAKAPRRTDGAPAPAPVVAEAAEGESAEQA
jgi:hypothetical protein